MGLLVDWTQLMKICDLKDMSTEPLKTEKWRKLKLKEQNWISKDCKTATRILDGEGRKEGAEVPETVMTENFLKLMADTKPRNLDHPN